LRFLELLLLGFLFKQESGDICWVYLGAMAPILPILFDLVQFHPNLILSSMQTTLGQMGMNTISAIAERLFFIYSS